MADELRIKAVLETAGFNQALAIVNAGLSAVSGFVQDIGIGAARYIGEMAVRSFTRAGRAALNFARDVAGAAFENHELHDTLTGIYNGLVDITRVTFTPLLNEINGLAQDAAPAFLGVLQRGGEYLGKLANDAFNYGENVANQFAQGIWNGFVYVVDALTGLGQLITFWLAPGSPPRILPDLDQWGTDAMNVWLSGWAKGDFGLFNKIAGTLGNLIRSFADPLSKGEGIIPQILGTREGIAQAVDELRRTGQVSQATLDRIVASVGSADASVRSYLESAIALEAANQDTADAQKALNDATAAYEALLKPIDARLGRISEEQAQFTEEQEKARLALVLKDPGATAAEKRQAALRLEQIDAERARRATVAQGEAAVDAAQDQLTAAQAAQAAAQEAFDTETARLQMLAEQNGLIADQIKLLESLKDKVAAAAGGGKGGAGGKKFEIDTSWIDDLISQVQSKLAILQAAWQLAWAMIRAKVQPVYDFINDHVIPLLTKLWGIISEAGSKAIQTLQQWWNGTFIPLLRTAWNWLNQHVIPKLTTLWSWLEIWLPIGVQKLADFFNNTLLPAILDIVTWTLILNATAFAKAWEWMETKLPAAGKTLNDFLTGPFSDGLRTFRDVFVAVFTEIQREVQTAIDLVGDLYDAIANVPNVGGHGTAPNGHPGGPAPNSSVPPVYIPGLPTGTGGSTTNTVTNQYNYSPTYQGAPPAPQLDFNAMNVWAQ